MSGTILVGIGHDIYRKADEAFLRALEELPTRAAARLSFMTPDHHLVRDFVVREMPYQRRAISALDIAKVTGLDLKKVSGILSDLERHLFFLVRNREGGVTWAFPVTVSTTPHKLAFSTGEHTFGA